MDIAYPKLKSKLKKAPPTLICIGSPSSQKSQMINDIFGTQFEVID